MTTTKWNVTEANGAFSFSLDSFAEFSARKIVINKIVFLCMYFSFYLLRFAGCQFGVKRTKWSFRSRLARKFWLNYVCYHKIITKIMNFHERLAKNMVVLPWPCRPWNGCAQSWQGSLQIFHDEIFLPRLRSVSNVTSINFSEISTLETLMMFNVCIEIISVSSILH